MILELNSITIVDLIQKGMDKKHPYAMMIARVQNLLQRDWQVHVKHVFREANLIADYLATIGHSLNLGRVCLYLSPPFLLRTILRDDLAGLLYLD